MNNAYKINRIKKVIDSCETFEQTSMAFTYCVRLTKYPSNMFISFILHSFMMNYWEKRREYLYEKKCKCSFVEDYTDTTF